MFCQRWQVLQLIYYNSFRNWRVCPRWIPILTPFLLLDLYFIIAFKYDHGLNHILIYSCQIMEWSYHFQMIICSISTLKILFWRWSQPLIAIGSSAFSLLSSNFFMNYCLCLYTLTAIGWHSMNCLTPFIYIITIGFFWLTQWPWVYRRGKQNCFYGSAPLRETSISDIFDISEYLIIN